MNHDPLEFGRCCACGRINPTVRNLITLPMRAPIDGTGWGCVVCDVPANGALAVLCDRCAASPAVQIQEVCYGYAATKQRQLYMLLSEPFIHDIARHEEALRLE